MSTLWISSLDIIVTSKNSTSVIANVIDESLENDKYETIPSLAEDWSVSKGWFDLHLQTS